MIEEIVEVVLNGETIKGTKHEVILKLRSNHDKTTYEIGDYLSMTHQGVSYHLRKYSVEQHPNIKKRKRKRRNKAKLSRDLLRRSTNKQLRALGVTQGEIYKIRKQHKIKSPMTGEQKYRRQNNFCKSVFGNMYKADVNFNNFLTNLCRELIKNNIITKREAQLLVDFYKYYKKDTASFRARRTLIRNDKIKPYVASLSASFLEKLLQGKVIKNK